MGYSTDFFGELEITPPLEPAQVAYLQAFNKTRRMKRDADKAATLPDPKRLAVGLPIGLEGCFYVGNEEDFGQGHDISVVDHNRAPGLPSWNRDHTYQQDKQLEQQAKAASQQAQPGLWCQWTVSNDGAELMWDEGEKFYDYVQWLEYLVANFLEPWGRKLNGSIDWSGEDSDDIGTIYVKDNTIEAVPSAYTNPGPSWEKKAVS